MTGASGQASSISLHLLATQEHSNEQWHNPTLKDTLDSSEGKNDLRSSFTDNAIAGSVGGKITGAKLEKEPLNTQKLRDRIKLSGLFHV